MNVELVEQKFPEGWNLKMKIEYLQRKVILNSIAYYKLDWSPMSDYNYDCLCRQLVDLQSKYGNVEDTQYGYVMYDFDGSTGFHLFNRLTEEDQDYLLRITERVKEKW